MALNPDGRTCMSIAFCTSEYRRYEKGDAGKYAMAFPVDGICKYWQ